MLWESVAFMSKSYIYNTFTLFLFNFVNMKLTHNY